MGQVSEFTSPIEDIGDVTNVTKQEREELITNRIA